MLGEFYIGFAGVLPTFRPFCFTCSRLSWLFANSFVNGYTNRGGQEIRVGWKRRDQTLINWIAYYEIIRFRTSGL
jgi:hypothetical protein